LATKSERAWEHLKDLDVSQPTRTNRRINEPDLEAPPPEPPRQNPNLTAEEPEPDPFELVKEQYRVNLADLLRWNISMSPGQEHVKEDRSTRFLLFDNYYEPVMVDGIEGLDLPLQTGDEQILFFWFYRRSYGFGYRVCAMGQLELANKLGWSRGRVKRHLTSLIKKGHVKPLKEFPPFRNYRAQIFEVMLPRQFLEQHIDRLADEQRRAIALEALQQLRQSLG
jgi:DNA-binding MarR family transcriptional regulator